MSDLPGISDNSDCVRNESVKFRATLVGDELKAPWIWGHRDIEQIATKQLIQLAPYFAIPSSHLHKLAYWANMCTTSVRLEIIEMHFIIDIEL